MVPPSGQPMRLLKSRQPWLATRKAVQAAPDDEIPARATPEPPSSMVTARLTWRRCGSLAITPSGNVEIVAQNSKGSYASAARIR